ncbi:hypothetical protein Q31b_38060 [Novipirellula aureliae]|uniref:ATPase AAA-type core domain-containing protein n=1 Tax=Novipirellula aureliae TaxID=2527966 RepID=A0A5C6DPR0_9BACT|nr:AAA family ATPase [Novipirellula aureliae]TWU38728.1 hypothetical protein Q31b_38060 [Novipirellula aureliae]
MDNDLIELIRSAGDREALDRAIHGDFPGARVHIHTTDFGMQLKLTQPGMLRDLTAAELSDGTLRFLLLVAALLTPRPPELMVLNEPDNSLHPDLVPAFARLITLAAERSQVIVVSHSQPLVEQLESDEICASSDLKSDSVKRSCKMQTCSVNAAGIGRRDEQGSFVEVTSLNEVAHLE